MKAAECAGLAADLVIGACAVEVGYAVMTSNARDFGRIAGLVVVEI